MPRPRGDSPLTQRQMQVAELVADGLTTGEIAERLFLSDRTIEFHIEQMYNTLGLRKRTELASWVARQRLRVVGPEEGATGGSNLPQEMDAFLGRAAELRRAREGLDNGRLITLVGPGGSGKTRMALHLGNNLASRYPDGVWLLELAPLSSGEILPQLLATRLGLEEPTGLAAAASLSESLVSHRALLLLDNCEHVIESVAGVVQALLTRTRYLRILATSREPLRVANESVIRLEALPEQDATALFMARANATGLDLADVGQLCRHLGGLPLAIELAAALVATMTPTEMIARVDRQLDLLTHGARSAPDRHRSLEATLDWSYGLLTDVETVLLRRLSVFASGFVLEAIETICPSSDLPARQVPAVLARLVDKSLVTAEGYQKETRYSLHDAVREYARGRPGAIHDAKSLAVSYVMYYEGILERPPVEESGWLGWMSFEQENLRLAVEKASVLFPERAASLVYRLCSWWTGAGSLSEGLHVANLVVQRCPSGTRGRALVLIALARLTRVQGDAQSALPWATEAGEIAAGLKPADPDVLAAALLQLAHIDDELGMMDGARDTYERAVAVARESGHRRLLCTALDAFGRYELRMGDVTLAAPLLSEALATAQGLAARASALQGLARLHLARGDSAAAHEALANSLSLSLKTGRVLLVANGLEVSASLALADGEPARALQLSSAAAAIRARARMTRGPWKQWIEAMETEARTRLSPDEASQAWHAGQEMGLDELVEYAAEA